MHSTSEYLNTFKTDNSTIVGNFTIPLLIMNSIQTEKSISNQWMGLKDFYRTFHWTSA